MDVIKSKIEDLKKEAGKRGLKWASIIGGATGAVIGGILGS